MLGQGNFVIAVSRLVNIEAAKFLINLIFSGISLLSFHNGLSSVAL